MRLLIVAFLVVATTTMGPDLGDAGAPSESPAAAVLIGAGLVLGGLSGLYALALRLLTSVRWLRALAFAQLLFDALFAAVLVFLTGGTLSMFVFLFSLIVLLGAFLLGARGAYFAATTGLVLLGAVGTTEMAGPTALNALLGLTHAPPTPPSGSTAFQLGAFVYRMLNNALALYAVAFMASHFAETLRRQDRAFHEQRKRLERLRALTEHIVGSMPSGVFTTDTSGRVTFANAGALAALPPDTTAVEGQRLEDLLPQLPTTTVEPSDDAPRTLGAGQKPITLRRGEGPDARVFECRRSPLHGNDGAYLGQVLLLQDVTEAHRLAREVQEAERFATIGKLAASIAHDIRNPLASISGAVQLLERSDETSEDDRRLMAIVGRETDALNRWITDFLTFARPQSAQRVTLDLGDVVRETLTVLLHDAASASIEAATRMEPGQLVRADPTYLRQVLWNVLKNALQAMPQGGRLEVSVEALSGHTGPWTRLTVTDSGEGIPEAVQQRVFEPFFTTKKGGTGLGLATARRVITELGGELHLRSHPGEVTSFFVDLPTVTSNTRDAADRMSSTAERGPRDRSDAGVRGVR